MSEINSTAFGQLLQDLVYPIYLSITIDMLDKVPNAVQKERMDICKSCEKLFKATDTCKACGCFMRVKSWLPNASCPLKKWTIYKTEN